MIAEALFTAAVACGSLTSLKLPHTTITMAQEVAAGAFTPPAAGGRGGRGETNVFAALPGFCRVALTLAATSDSDIKVEVWLPLAGWNGKYQAVGNGGWAGTISYPAMAAALGRGYATSGGKLLPYHGWSDPLVAPQASVRYYDSVVKEMGGPQKTAGWVRLFMVRAWGTAAAARDRTRSTWSPRSSSGSNTARRPHASSHRASPAERSSARGRCVRTRRWRSTTALAARTRRRISRASDVTQP
jgi:hypothetical protein